MKDKLSLLVSDYDGTYMDVNDSKLVFENNEIIKYLIDNNMIFMLSTGRMYYSILEEINKYNIPYNYVSCANGCVSLDNNGNVLNYNVIKKKDTTWILNYYKYFDDFHFLDLLGDKTDSEGIELLVKINDKYLNIKKSIIKDLLLENNLDYYSDRNDKLKLHIFRKIGKIEPIKAIQKSNDISNERVICVGDSMNDLDMIKEYNGYIISGGKISKKYPALKKYKCMRDLLLDIKEKKLIKKL